MRRSGIRWRELAASDKPVVNGFWLAVLTSQARFRDPLLLAAAATLKLPVLGVCFERDRPQLCSCLCLNSVAGKFSNSVLTFEHRSGTVHACGKKNVFICVLILLQSVLPLSAGCRFVWLKRCVFRSVAMAEKPRWQRRQIFMETFLSQNPDVYYLPEW